MADLEPTAHARLVLAGMFGVALTVVFLVVVLLVGATPERLVLVGLPLAATVGVLIVGRGLAGSRGR